jgi:hypothetical protein
VAARNTDECLRPVSPSLRPMLRSRHGQKGMNRGERRGIGRKVGLLSRGERGQAMGRFISAPDSETDHPGIRLTGCQESKLRLFDLIFRAEVFRRRIGATV